MVSIRPMKKAKKSGASWLDMLPSGLRPGELSLDELRSAKRAHEFLTEELPAPAAIAYHIRCFRYLLFFGVSCVHDNKFPALTRCWNDLDQRFTQDPFFDDDLLVQSWALLDFPFGPKGETALDHFAQFVRGSEAESRFVDFISSARKTRLGLYEDVKHTSKDATVRELFTGAQHSFVPTMSYGRGEILLARIWPYADGVFMFGDAKGYPREFKQRLEDMVLSKMFSSADPGQGERSERELYERFMKRAGPYWMSCVTKNADAEILSPDHYRSYLEAAPVVETGEVDDKLGAALASMGAKLAPWQVRALFLGAQASTNPRLGPAHLIGHLFDGPAVLGANVLVGDANLQVLLDTWNSLVTACDRGHLRLSDVKLPQAPTAADLTQFVQRRLEEIRWFIKGVDAGGDDPIEFGPEGQQVLTNLAEAAAFFESYATLLRDKDDHTSQELAEGSVALKRLSAAAESMVRDFVDCGAAVRRSAFSEHAARRGRRTDDGVLAPAAEKVERNATCPCGSGRKWKRCCGAPARLQ